MRTRAGTIDDDVSIAADKIVNAFLADEDLHHLYNKATLWIALVTAVLTESSIPRKIPSCTLHRPSSRLAMVGSGCHRHVPNEQRAENGLPQARMRPKDAGPLPSSARAAPPSDACVEHD